MAVTGWPPLLQVHASDEYLNIRFQLTVRKMSIASFCLPAQLALQVREAAGLLDGSDRLALSVAGLFYIEHLT